jgi:hypothetical protein
MASTTPPSPIKKEQLSELGTERKEQELSPPPSEDSQPDSNQVLEPSADDPPLTQEQQWVSGLKLLPIMIAVTLGSFLMLLDTSIIVTACVKALRFRFAAKKST